MQRKIIRLKAALPQLTPRKKVAAYARVSADSSRPHHSLSAQVSYYNDFIQRNSLWQFAGVYADEGISGTSIRKRTGFKELLAACEEGKIDLILTKSISRFGRNTVELLATVRHLKELGIEVRFEKEHLSTFSQEGEMLLSILASFAQEESRSISENAKWRIRKQFKKGIPYGLKRMLGYRWENKKLMVVAEEAAIVKKIYYDYLGGKSRGDIRKELREQNLCSINGTAFSDFSIYFILTNITYTGNLVLQRYFSKDALTGHSTKNKGELPKYFVEDSHEAIIPMDVFQKVQKELQRRRDAGSAMLKYATCFTSKIICGHCHCSYVKFSNNYGNTYWVCSTTRNRSKDKKCTHRFLPENILKAKCCEVLHLKEFDDKVFLQKVDYINVPESQVLEFHLHDGQVITTEWQHTGKKDCWTAKRRQEWSAYQKSRWTPELRQKYSVQEKKKWTPERRQKLSERMRRDNPMKRKEKEKYAQSNTDSSYYPSVYRHADCQKDKAKSCRLCPCIDGQRRPGYQL